MKGVILAAGSGTRLAPLTLNIPKPLISVLGHPLIDYTISAFVEVGIVELIIVIGYKEAMIREWVGDGSRYGARVEYAFNLNYTLRNAVSLYAAQQMVGEDPFVLTMADHMISPRILSTLLSFTVTEDALCVDQSAKAPPQLNDATKVLIDEKGYILRIGKRIKKWNAIDTGVFLLTPTVFTAISHLMGKKRQGPNLSQCINWLIRRGGKVRACDVSGCFWMDVDTWEDLRYVERILKEEPLCTRRWSRLLDRSIGEGSIDPFLYNKDNWKGIEPDESLDIGN